MRLRYATEAGLVRALAAGLRLGSWERSIASGAAIGTLAYRLGIRGRVARENLRLAFPELDDPAREEILRQHFRELGRVVAEYARFAELARSRESVREIHGLEHFDAVRSRGRGAILMSGHYGSFEMLAAMLARDYPIDVVTRRLSNPGVETWIDTRRRAAGLGIIQAETGMREVYGALRANRFVAMLADQNAGRHGVFVPFFGRLASTAVGPARIAIATGAPIVMGFCVREPDGRIVLEIEPPLEVEDPRAKDAVVDLTARHTARLEHWVRRHPAMWFWLHRRWKTRPPERAAKE